MRAKPIGKAKCILIRHDWEHQNSDGTKFQWHLTENKVYNVLKEATDLDSSTQWITIIADDGQNRTCRRDWFEWLT